MVLKQELWKWPTLCCQVSIDHMYATKPRFTIETLGGVVSIEVEVEPDKKQ